MQSARFVITLLHIVVQAKIIAEGKKESDVIAYVCVQVTFDCRIECRPWQCHGARQCRIERRLTSTTFSSSWSCFRVTALHTLCQRLCDASATHLTSHGD